MLLTGHSVQLCAVPGVYFILRKDCHQPQGTLISSSPSNPSPYVGTEPQVNSRKG